MYDEWFVNKKAAGRLNQCDLQLLIGRRAQYLIDTCGMTRGAAHDFIASLINIGAAIEKRNAKAEKEE